MNTLNISTFALFTLVAAALSGCADTADCVADPSHPDGLVCDGEPLEAPDAEPAYLKMPKTIICGSLVCYLANSSMKWTGTSSCSGSESYATGNATAGGSATVTCTSYTAYEWNLAEGWLVFQYGACTNGTSCYEIASDISAY
jgi:hypothetical protein